MKESKIMDVLLIIKLKSSYEAWHETFTNHADIRLKVCDDSKTLVGKVDNAKALVTIFDVDMMAMGAMMADPEFVKMNAKHVEELIPHSITPLNPTS
jgi:hypothetical protein